MGMLAEPRQPELRGTMGTNRTGLWTASLIACGLFLAEDPAVIAVRQHLRHPEASAREIVLIDAAMAAVMLVYNVIATRYVVRVSSSDAVERAIAQLDAERPTRGRIGSFLHGLNPFHVIKQLAERAGDLLDRAGTAASRRGRSASSALLGDLAVVNLLGVPGAGIQRVATGRRLSAADSFRLSALFVGSWFAGAWAIEAVLDAVAGWPVIGPVLGGAWHAIGRVYAAITDVGTPLGAVCVAGFAGVVLRYVWKVERRARRLMTLPMPPA